jgi:hypothetical protein
LLVEPKAIREQSERRPGLLDLGFPLSFLMGFPRALGCPCDRGTISPLIGATLFNSRGTYGTISGNCDSPTLGELSVPVTDLIGSKAPCGLKAHQFPGAFPLRDTVTMILSSGPSRSCETTCPVKSRGNVVSLFKQLLTTFASSLPAGP